MLLTIDVGNTNITFAVFDGCEIRADWRIGTVARRTGDEYAALLLVLFGERGLSFADINGVAISSVVPATVDSLVRFSKKHLKVDSPLVLGSEIDPDMKINYEPKSDVGADRIANAIAAHAKYGGKVIVVDFGTATTLDAVSADGEYLGGAIAPGIQISLEALFSRAARLTGVQIAAPEKAIGTTTTGSLQSGIVFGFAGQVDALVDRFQDEMGGDAKVVATGGLAEIIAEYSRTIECCDEMLTLEGLRLIYEKMRG
jgi:type III pantothenate kinase